MWWPMGFCPFSSCLGERLVDDGYAVRGGRILLGDAAAREHAGADRVEEVAIHFYERGLDIELRLSLGDEPLLQLLSSMGV